MRGQCVQPAHDFTGALIEDYIFRLAPRSEFLDAQLCEFQVFHSLDPNESGGILFQIS